MAEQLRAILNQQEAHPPTPEDTPATLTPTKPTTTATAPADNVMEIDQE